MANRNVEAAADLFIKKDLTSEAVDAFVGADCEFTQVAGACIRFQFLEQIILVLVRGGLNNLAVFEFKADIIHLKSLVKMLYVHQGGRDVDSGAPGGDGDGDKKKRDLAFLLGEIEDKVARYKVYDNSTRKTQNKTARDLEASEASTATPAADA